MSGDFEPTRLAAARKRRALKKKELAEKADISSRILSDYENGDRVPSDATLLKLASALSYPPAFFFGDPIEEFTSEIVSFRALTKMTSGQRDAALSAGSLAFELHRWVAQRFQLPDADIPQLDEFDDAEAAANAVRQDWGMGSKPIHNVVHRMEAHGVRVFTLAERCKEVDAYSFWFDDEPFVFLNTQKSGERSRMDAAHELGHLVMHRGHQVPQGPDAEREAKAFASAFLMPSADVIAVMSEYPNPTLEELVQLKARWRVSVAGLLYRLSQLTLVSEWHARSLWQEISKSGIRSSEPNGIPRETSLVLRQVFESLRNEGIGIAEVARSLKIPTDELSSFLVGLVIVPMTGKGIAGESKNEYPPLRLVE